MQRIIFFMLTSLDGYFEGPDRDINWHNVDDEFNEFADPADRRIWRAPVWAGDL